MKLSIIIVSFNTAQLIQNCLKSVYHALKKGNLEGSSEVIVVDNASTDDSVKMVEKNFSQTYLICSRKNLGFAKGNNLGIKKSNGKYILLLNSDTVVVDDALIKLVKEAESDKQIGVIGGKLLNLDDSLQASCGFFPHLAKIFFWMTFIDDLPLLSMILKPYHQQNPKFYEKSRNVDWVSGACFLASREAVQKVNLMDENIFMYGEEVEWCYRIKKSGFKVVYSPKAIIYHYKGGSGEGKISGIIEEFAFLTYFYQIHKPRWQLFILRVLLIFGAMLRVGVFGIIERNFQKAGNYVKVLKMVR